MRVASAFAEVGWTLLAVVCPVILLAIIVAVEVSCRRSRRRRGDDIAKTAWTGNPAYMLGGIDDAVGGTIQVIVALLLVINIITATVPYGRCHGWW